MIDDALRRTSLAVLNQFADRLRPACDGRQHRWQFERWRQRACAICRVARPPNGSNPSPPPSRTPAPRPFSPPADFGSVGQYRTSKHGNHGIRRRHGNAESASCRWDCCQSGSNPPLSASSIVYRQSDYYVRPRCGYAVMKNGQTLAENVAKNPGLLLGDGR